MSKPKLVGITGGIGSGKSTVCKIFEVLGVKVYYADDRAKWLMENDLGLVEGIKSIFGDEAYLDGSLNRSHVSKKAFDNKEFLQQLNQLVHPAVKKDFGNWVGAHSSEKILLKEAALLIEAKSHQELDSLILVVSNEQTRINRVLHRDSHRNEEGVRKIISEQLSDEEKIPLVDFVITNNEGDSLIKQVMRVYEQLVVA